MLIRKCHVHIEGVSPYSPSADIGEKPKKYTWAQWEELKWRERAHVKEETGKVIVPFMAFKKALSSAALLTVRRVTGKGNKTFSSIVKAGVLIDTALALDITREDLSCERFSCSSTGDATGRGARVMRTFPRIDRWGGWLTFHILHEDISEDIFEEYLAESGLMVGVGRFRPENGGVNGRFIVKDKKWEVM